MSRPAVWIWTCTVILNLLVCSGLPAEEVTRSQLTPSYQGTLLPGQEVMQPTQGVLEGTLDPGQYVLGAGDVLAIGFWGDVNRYETVTVNPDGEILVSPVGPIPVDGLTLSEVRDIVKAGLAPYYRPSILSVSLISIRSFQVHVVGMVATPGALEVTAVARASQAIGLAGGLIGGASQRNIVIRRDSALVPVDMSSYLLLGDNDLNPFLRGGDVVYVPPSLGMVHVYGSVFRPGAYEFIEGEVLGQLLDLAGGFRPEALIETIEVQRFDADDPTVSEALSLRGEPGVLADFDVMLGDRVFIRAVPDWHEDAKVELHGEVAYPGVYVIEDGVERLSEIIDRAGGFTEKASLAESRLIRGTYTATRFAVETELDLMRAMESPIGGKDGDLLKTLSREPKGRVSISFEEVFLEGDGSNDLPLFDGDIIDIRPTSRFVRVSGHVRDPGLIQLNSGEGYRYYIKQAGDFAPGADTRGTRLIRAVNGQKIRPRGEAVRPGDIIWIPERGDRDWWGITKDVLQVLAQIATIYLIADTVSSR